MDQDDQLPGGSRPGSPEMTEFFTHAVRSKNPYEETMQRLLQAIRLGMIGVGERLPAERDLATMLGVSRTTVREALATLAEAGYVVSRRGRSGGTFVVDARPAPVQDAPAPAPFTEGDLDDLAALRRVLEIGAVTEAAARDLSAPERASLALALEECDAADTENFRRLDSRLHLAFAELAGSPSLVQLVADMRTRLNAKLDHIPMMAPNLLHSQEQHHAIVQAILFGQPSAAAAAMAEHIEGTDALLRGFLATGRGVPR